jgi:hypothetical protein
VTVFVIAKREHPQGQRGLWRPAEDDLGQYALVRSSWLATALTSVASRSVSMMKCSVAISCQAGLPYIGVFGSDVVMQAPCRGIAALSNALHTERVMA